jgi:predicted DNA-binding protein (UPF0251 family)
MHDPLRLTHMLEHSSQRLDQLLSDVRRFEPQLVPVELLDEIAATIGELTLVLMDHHTGHHSKEVATRLIAHAQRLRKDLRSRELSKEQIAVAIGALGEEVNRMIRQDKRAA